MKTTMLAKKAWDERCALFSKVMRSMVGWTIMKFIISSKMSGV
jgi:hypothetical protein